jgi:predicted O-methyltransferase YrrM
MTGQLATIPVHQPADPWEPYWLNGWLPALDGIALYGLIALHRPRRYVEIGSGNSTKFARRAIRDHRLATLITSIDPRPRAEVDALCEQVVRLPLEETKLDFLDDLEPGDFVFFDGSHRCLMNSDVTVFFLEVLPRLKPGTLVQIHDVTLPYDYPPDWANRAYSEQYLLAVYLLARAGNVRVVFPAAYISDDPELSRTLEVIWADPRFAGAERHGGSFWFETQ